MDSYKVQVCPLNEVAPLIIALDWQQVTRLKYSMQTQHYDDATIIAGTIMIEAQVVTIMEEVVDLIDPTLPLHHPPCTPREVPTLPVLTAARTRGPMLTVVVGVVMAQGAEVGMALGVVAAMEVVVEVGMEEGVAMGALEVGVVAMATTGEVEAVDTMVVDATERFYSNFCIPGSYPWQNVFTCCTFTDSSFCSTVLLLL